MSKPEVFEGQTHEDIIDQACDHFQCHEDDLEIIVLEETEKRNLLLRKERWIKAEARVRNEQSPGMIDEERPEPEPREPFNLQGFFDTLLEMSGVAEGAEIMDGEDHFHVDLVNLQSKSLQEGKEILDSIQHLASRYLIRHGVIRKLIVDSQGLRQRREAELDAMIRDIHDYVTKGKTTTTQLLTPGERRHLHLALDEMGGVKTVSIGRGVKKRVRIFPRERRGRGPSPRFESSNY